MASTCAIWEPEGPLRNNKARPADTKAQLHINPTMQCALRTMRMSEPEFGSIHSIFRRRTF